MNRKNRKNRKWENWEIQYLKDNYETGSMTVIEMAAHIGRTYGAVLTEAKKLGLKRKRKIYPQQYRNRVKVKPREVQDASYTNICASVLDGDSFEKIARDTNRPVEQVKEIYEAGVRKGRLDAIKRYRSDGYAGQSHGIITFRKALSGRAAKTDKE